MRQPCEKAEQSAIPGGLDGGRQPPCGERADDHRSRRRAALAAPAERRRRAKTLEGVTPRGRGQVDRRRAEELRAGARGLRTRPAPRSPTPPPARTPAPTSARASRAAARRTSRSCRSPAWSSSTPTRRRSSRSPPTCTKEIDANYTPYWKELGSADGQVYGVLIKAAHKSLVWYRAAGLRGRRRAAADHLGRAGHGRADDRRLRHRAVLALRRVRLDADRLVRERLPVQRGPGEVRPSSPSTRSRGPTPA